MSVLDGPGEGTWSVFAAKVVAERDEARAETARLRRLLNMAEDELVAADDHGRREAKRADNVEAEVEALKAERDEALARCETLRELADAAAYEQGLAQRRMMDAQRERDEARDREAEWAQNSIEWQRNCEEARAEVEHAYREGGALYEAKIAEREAFRCGAEAMREAAANALDMAGQGTLCDTRECEHWGRYVRALPIPEEP